jgi:glutathionylspermidine synthase
MYFASVAEHLEDYMTVNYLRDTAHQAGLATEFIPIEQIGWNGQFFTDLGERPIRQIFKLYPWEWLVREEFGPHLLDGDVRWLEAPWKMLLSNKAILPVLYELFPDSPYLLEASYEPFDGSYVRKPILAREGANLRIVENGRTVLETDGQYEGPYVYQRLYPLRSFDGNHPVVGSWLVNGYACGIGIREDHSPVTKNTSRFVPHVIAT